MTLNEVMSQLPVEAQFTLKGMLAQASISSNPHITEVINKLTELRDNFNTNQKLILLALQRFERGRFAAKLDHTRRCQVLALHRTGVTREQLALAFNINRRTVTHIYNSNSPHYRSVREEEQQLGVERFREKYLTQGIIDHALAFRQIKEAAGEKSNKHANNKAGMHVVRGRYCKQEHRVVIAWKEDEVDQPGWYYNDLDGDFPDQWLSAGSESLRTSNACYVAMLSDIEDKM